MRASHAYASVDVQPLHSYRKEHLNALFKSIEFVFIPDYEPAIDLTHIEKKPETSV